MIGMMSVYGLIVVGGGYLGYKKAGSEMSLIMGCASGAIIFLSAIISLFIPVIGYTLFTLLTLALSVVFLIRLFKTAKFMPAGIMLPVSIATSVFSILQLLPLYK